MDRHAKGRGSQKTCLSVLLALGLTMTAIALGFFLYQTRASESTSFADVSWVPSGSPREISCTLVDSDGIPLPQVTVAFRNNSGFMMDKSDSNGRLRIVMGELDLSEIRIVMGELDISEILVNDIYVMKRRYSYWLRAPNVTNGLRIQIVAKEPLVRAIAEKD